MGTVTRTVVFTDLANYTAQVSATDRQGLHRILEEHEAVVQPIVERSGGVVVKNLGDSFMCLFQAATDALRASLDIQHKVGTDGTPLRLAMTTGDVEEVKGDAFGEAVNLAARVLSKTPAGEVWFGPGTRVCMNAAEIPWESVGRFRLRGIPGEKEIFRAVPQHRCWLPDPVATAVKMGNVIRLRRGHRAPLLPPDPVILLEGFLPGSPALAEAVDSLPVLNPASLYLACYNIASEDRNRWTDSGRGLVVGTPSAIDAAINDALKAVKHTSGSDTIVLDIGLHADLELVMCGLALPAVPFSDVVSSYSYDLLADGRWVNRSERSLLRIEVSEAGTSLASMGPGITVEGRGVASGEKVRLDDRARIGSKAGNLVFRQLDNGYAGIIVSETDMRLGVVSGQTAELGREPNHPGLAFPDRRGQDNIQWCPGPRAARARAGGFTLDRALAGRRQAAVQLVGDSIQLTPLHPRCPTYVLRAEDDRGLQKVARATHVELGDLIVAGTTVVGLRQPE
ncbi:MAG: hypothetical protein ACI9K2_007371 [Myxococcota bacterium]